jgi:hypothetical protein
MLFNKLVLLYRILSEAEVKFGVLCTDHHEFEAHLELPASPTLLPYTQHVVPSKPQWRSP